CLLEGERSSRSAYPCPPISEPPRSSRGLCPSSIGRMRAGGGGPQLLGEAPTTCRNPATRRHVPHAELESGASVGTSDLEVKTTTRVRVSPRTDFPGPF